MRLAAAKGPEVAERGVGCAADGSLARGVDSAHEPLDREEEMRKADGVVLTGCGLGCEGEEGEAPAMHHA